MALRRRRLRRNWRRRHFRHVGAGYSDVVRGEILLLVLCLTGVDNISRHMSQSKSMKLESQEFVSNGKSWALFTTSKGIGGPMCCWFWCSSCW